VRISPKLNSLSVFITFAGLAFAFIAGPAAAQNTTSSIRVEVTNQSGAPVSGVSVEVSHLPTGRAQTSSSNNQGIATLRGIAVGGPYEVSIVGGSEYAADVMQDIYVELDETAVINITVRPIIEEIIVTAKAPTGALVVGIGRSFDRAEIDATPSIGRDFTSVIARDPKILVDNSVARGPAVSMAGQNFRFNSVTIDGIPQNDNFGLNKNASATSRTPISIDAVQAVTVNIAPYDVSYGNFVGGNINIVTKSGTNEFHGSAFYYSTDDSLSGSKSDGKSINIADFEEDTYGFTIGGPIIKDKLFFFANYEKFETTLPAAAADINSVPGVDQADVDLVRTVLMSEYGFDPGLYETTDTDEDEKRLLKIDWFLNDDHRAIASYQYAKTDVLFDDFSPTVAALHSNRYNINQEMTAYSLQVFSNWTDKLSTEVKIGTKEVIRRDRSVDGTTNEFLIIKDLFNNEFGTILAGGDRFRHSNELDNESDLFRIEADYATGDHILTLGWERESKSVRNRFLPFSKGLIVFASIADLGDGDPLTTADRIPLDVVYGNSNTGVATDAEANFTLDVDSFYIQDEWQPSDDLTLTFGVRYDTLTNDDPITDNPNFLARQGYTNGFNLDGNDLLQPRFGFNWTTNDRLTIRGGAGLFGGGAPLIILSNSYAGDGISRTFACPAFCFPQAAIDATMAALPDANAAFANLQPFLGVDPTAATDVIHPNYEILSTWKYSIGAEYIADLGFLGDEWVLSADLIIAQVNDGYDIDELRRTVIDTAPDGRPIYDSPGFGFGTDYSVINTSEGSGTIFTFSASKQFDTRAGIFDTTFGYAYQDVDELRSYNRFITFETHVFDTGTDHNNPVVAPSRFEVENRVTATVSWSKELFGDNVTSAGLVYAGRSGRHYSYVFGSAGVCTFGGSALSDCGAEGDIVGNQLFYVPTGPADPFISGDAAFLADLDEYIDGESCLNGSRGSIVTRNNCETDWINIFSVRFMQEIKVGDSAFDLMLDIENIGNLINSDWGRVDSYRAPSVLAPAIVSIPVAGGPYLLEATSSYDPAVGANSIVADPEIAALPSVYRIQLGVRFRF
jgi:hypothetical protein